MSDLAWWISVAVVIGAGGTLGWIVWDAFTRR